MASLRQTREALLLSHAIEVIDEEEFLLLYDLNKSKNPGYPSVTKKKLLYGFMPMRFAGVANLFL